MFRVIYAACASGFLPTAGFGEMPAAGDLLGIAKESFEKGLLKANMQRIRSGSCDDLSAEDYTRQKVEKGSDIDKAFYGTRYLWNSCAAHVLNAYEPEKYAVYLKRGLETLGIFLSGTNPKLSEKEAFFQNPSTKISEDAIKGCNEMLSRWVHEHLVEAAEPAFGSFFVERMKPFLEEELKKVRLFDAVADAARDLGHFIRTLQEAFEKNPSAEIDAKIIQSFKEKKEAFMRSGFEKLASDEYFDYSSTIGDYVGTDRFWERIASLECVKELDIARRKLFFKRFNPKNFEAAEEKAKDNFAILGLDMDCVKYPNPFKSQKRREQVGEFLKKEVECFTEEIRSAYKRIGDMAEKNFIDALKLLYPLTEKAWTRERFDPKPVMQAFEEAMLKCDIEVLINENKPRSDNNELHEGFKRLREEKSIDTSAVEKDIYDIYIARYEDDVKKRFYALVTALRNLTNHRISFIDTVRRIEDEVYENTEKVFEETVKQVTDWRKKQEEYVQTYRLAEANFYKTFFGGKKKDWQGNFVATIGDVKQPKCLEILEERLKDYGLWEPIVRVKKEAPKEPNSEKQNRIIEDKKQPETVKKEETIPQEYTQLSNEKELKKPTRTRRGNNNG